MMSLFVVFVKEKKDLIEFKHLTFEKIAAHDKHGNCIFISIGDLSFQINAIQTK